MIVTPPVSLTISFVFVFRPPKNAKHIFLCYKKIAFISYLWIVPGYTSIHILSLLFCLLVFNVRIKQCTAFSIGWCFTGINEYLMHQHVAHCFSNAIFKRRKKNGSNEWERERVRIGDISIKLCHAINQCSQRVDFFCKRITLATAIPTTNSI